MSSPRSRKGQFFSRKFETAGMSLAIPDLNVPSFEDLTISAMLDAVSRTIAAEIPNDASIGIIGSGLGGIVALHAAARNRRVRHLMLLGPALSLFRENFLGVGRIGLKQWKKQGYFDVHDHATGVSARISANFVLDAHQYNEDTLKLTVPITIMHGERDELMDPRLSIEYAGRNENVALHLVDDDHDLLVRIGEAWDILWRDIRPTRAKPGDE